MTSIFFLICIFSSNLYFSTAGIFKLNYEGLESGDFSYWIYLLILLFGTVCYYFIIKLKQKMITNKELFIIIALNFFVLLFFFRNIIIYNITSIYSLQQLLLFIIFLVPSIIAGWYFNLHRAREMRSLHKNLEIIMLIFSLGIFISTFQVVLTGGKFESIGGDTYQTASYISAFSFGVNLYYIIFGKNFQRYRFTRKTFYKILQYILLLIQLVSLFAGGGRGAFVLLVAYIITYFSILVIKGNSKINFKHLISVVLMGILIILVFQFFWSDIPIISDGIIRVFDFISSDGINWNGTSGRDTVYMDILNIVKKNPYIGVGFFNYMLPHNLFLEVLVASGLIGFIVYIIFLSIFLVKFVQVLKHNSENYVLIVIFLYPSVMLMFSGSFLKNSIFWFVISFVYFYDYNQKKMMK